MGRKPCPNHYRIEGDTGYLTIINTKGTAFTVTFDADDFEALSAKQWHVAYDSRSKNGYCANRVKRDTVLLAQRLLVDVPDGHKLIFLNRDTLDIRRANLIHLPVSEAYAKIGMMRAPRERHPFVSYHKGRDRWTCVDADYKYAGTFRTEAEALARLRELHDRGGRR